MKHILNKGAFIIITNMSDGIYNTTNLCGFAYLAWHLCHNTNYTHIDLKFLSVK